ncbi:MAG: hypothetical protein K0Q51_1151 [Rickettsiaceae bacterium]|jgi:transcriptional regulator with XRE-family HTH domain|nr:hypothetical protein [Rickettsiaceae bacterium]
MNNIATHIKRIMRDKGFNIPQLAKASGVNEIAVRNIIYGKSTREDYVEKIAQALNLTLEYLVALSQNYSTETLIITTKIILNQLAKEKIKNINQESYNKLFYKVYEKADDFKKKFGVYKEEELNIFAEGIIITYLSLNIISSET